MVPASVLAGCPDKTEPPAKQGLKPDSFRDVARGPEGPLFHNSYALLLGRTVKSRTCVRMLDICIPFSCETNGKSSAIN